MTTATEPDTTQGPTRRQRWVRRVLVAIATLVMLAAVTGWYWWAEVQTYHLLEVSHNILYRDGNRDLREFRHALERTGARTVVSLVDDGEVADPAKPQFAQEAAYCHDHGIQQVRIPVRRGGWPTSDQIHQFLTIVAYPANRPVLVHCAQGVRRTGIFVAAYQLSVEHESPSTVRSEIQRFGHSSRDTADIEAFIGRFNPATRTVPTTMPTASLE
jgi:protein tyrosine phosphatase (PTP) superfamily phosphohydrolase (DUF442 family)